VRYIVRNITIESKTRGSQAVEDASVRPLDRPGIPVSHQILGTWKQPTLLFFFFFFFLESVYFVILVTVLHYKCYVVSEIISVLHSAL
jgi:hypothetical protein